MHLTVKDGFPPLFYRALWKRDYAECRKLLEEAAKYPELLENRWEKEGRLAFATHNLSAREQAAAVEQTFEERQRVAPNDGSISEAIVAVKFILGKGKEGLRVAEESVAKHPLSEDALSNIPNLELLEYACLYAGENERAIQVLTKLVQIPSMSYGYGRLKYDPLLDPLRGDSRFPQLVEQSRQPFPRL